MHAFQQDLSRGYRRHGWGLWITLFILAFSVLASSTSVTLEVRIPPASGPPAASELPPRFPDGALRRGIWIAYRPWKLRFGTGVSPTQGVLLTGPTGAWCTRTVSQGATPRGAWEATLVTCLHGPPRASAIAWEPETRATEPKERSR